jgi:hypothetical protein
VTIDFSKEFGDFCHWQCDTMPEKCPRTTQLHKLKNPPQLSDWGIGISERS